MRRNPYPSPGQPDAEPAKCGPAASANPAGNRPARTRSACARSVPGNGLRVDTDGQPPRCDGVTGCHRNVRLPPTKVAHRAIGIATPGLAGTSLGDRVQQSESRPHRGHSRSSKKGCCGDPPGSLACGLYAKGTAPSIGHGGVAATGANPAPADSPGAESDVSNRRELGDSRTSCLNRQNTAERTEIPGHGGGRPQN